MSIEFLFSKLQQEKATGELQTLQKDFYEQVDKLMFNLDNGTVSADGSKQRANTEKMLISLKEKRRQKILLYLAYNKPFPSSMPAEEETLCNEVKQIMNKDPTQIKMSRLKITSTVPEVLTTKGRKIGPFKQGEIVEIADIADAEFIIKNKIGEIIA